ncbi:MAG TPA: T9SS type A sorting domain-containing protein, partial [Bacteroidales bacterium]|nr:T9SS type A sorting domain-containing protein [Bacteroidales bacterium]
IPTQVSVWDGSAQPWVFGDGSQANPYIIENASQLAYMANVINANSAFYDEKHFELIADIDLGGYQWFGIGNSASNPFRGHFEGNNHTIDNLNIDIVGSTPVYIGLFGYLDSASVRNLHIIGNGVISLNNNNTATYYIGSVAAYLNHSSVIGCSNSTQFDINRTTTVSTIFNTYVGGIVGYATGNLSLVQGVLNKGEINYSFGLVYSNTSSYSWYHYVGGVVGYMNNGASLADAGHVNAINLLSDIRGYAKYSYLYGGGLVGYMTGSSANPITIARSYNRGNVSLTLNTNHTYTSSSYPMYSYGYVGGIAGYSSAYNTITDCYNRGALTPVLYAQSSYNANYSTNNTYIAGILGYMASTTSYTFANCYNTANIPATCTTSGNGTNNYYSDAQFYNSSTLAATNSYHLNSCCANNAHFSISKTQTELRDLQMIHSLNVGTPGSGIWKQDRMPYQNSGYPLFVDGFYDIGIETKRATDVTAISAQLNGYIDTTVHDLSTISQVGFQYKLEGSASYITVPTTSDANPLLLLTQLTPCTTYTYRLYVYSGGNYLYGDTLNFQTLCQATDTINAITCYGDPFIIDGQTYTTPGTYYQIIQDTTFVINYNNYPSRMLILDTTLIYGNSLLINGVYYSQTGTYTIVFDTDLHGCDSTILLNLTVIPDLQSTVTSQNVSCHGDRTGVIIVTPSEGAPPYKIEIFNALDTNTLVAGQQNIQTSRPISITNLPAANYIVVVSDANGFTVTSSVSITEPLALTLQLLSQTNVSCLENQDGEASVSVQGGEAPYTYLWSNNETTPQATMLPFGTQSVEVTDANQCTVALSVQINQNPQIENELFITNCDNYVWNGVTYSSSGRYSQLFSAANGCDSIVFLNLTISTFTTHDIYRTACNDFTWYGTQYNTSGVYSYTLTDANANGCDSILYLHLTINYPTHSDIYHTACESYTWFGQILAETGTYFYTIPNGNANGCDSILQLHLTINQPSSYHFTVITDRPYVWDATGATYNQSGVYSHFISGGNMYGCDSTVYLHLTIEIDTTGIDDYENNFTLQVMPNPTISDVSVKFTGDYFYLKEVQLFDVYGKLLTRKRIDSDEMKLPMATYSSGLYFLRFTDGKKTYRTVKVIKE